MIYPALKSSKNKHKCKWVTYYFYFVHANLIIPANKMKSIFHRNHFKSLKVIQRQKKSIQRVTLNDDLNSENMEND